MATTTLDVKLVFGGASFGPGKYFTEEATLEQVYKLLEEAGVDTIDTGRAYGVSEAWIGNTGGGKRFTIDSKTEGGAVPGGSTSETIPQHAKNSIEVLGVDKLDVFYIHAPDRSTPLEDQLLGVNTAYEAGYFKRFGLSNYLADEVQRVYDICKEKGYVLPTVYQGNYSALARKKEEVLIATLRKLGIAFYVYSPIAGGLLTKTSTQLRERKDAGRFTEGTRFEGLYRRLYNKPEYHKALDLWEELAKEVGCSKGELAYRWVAFDSVVDAKYGDAIVFGARELSHIPETVAWLRGGSLGGKVKAKIDEIWKVVEAVAPVDSFNG
ncbi:NADP-dependent oxidoreductase domain-containing protein [Mycena metata]|uniref:NADP-dependent oxidoreductase domain-containing protein n=1 Tax=Mycena metata TaxID=1033252 RepID=A0AAD7JP28_9AGAR|nr:NADP-dependent oxidoreductase domain-containing protein [Mycena metata]